MFRTLMSHDHSLRRARVQGTQVSKMNQVPFVKLSCSVFLLRHVFRHLSTRGVRHAVRLGAAHVYLPPVSCDTIHVQSDLRESQIFPLFCSHWFPRETNWRRCQN